MWWSDAGATKSKGHTWHGLNIPTVTCQESMEFVWRSLQRSDLWNGRSLVTGLRIIRTQNGWPRRSEACWPELARYFNSQNILRHIYIYTVVLCMLLDPGYDCLLLYLHAFCTSYRSSWRKLPSALWVQSQDMPRCCPQISSRNRNARTEVLQRSIYVRERLIFASFLNQDALGPDIR